MIDEPSLILVYEPETACLDALARQGIAGEPALEIASYLAQATDIAPELPAIAAACAGRGIGFAAVPLDEAAPALDGRDPDRTLVWTLTDGIAYFRGGAAPALARLHGLPRFGADDSLFALCQDKFRSGAVLRALGLPVPEAGLARGGRWLVPPPPSPSGYFVKPNRLGAKIGIWADSRVADPAQALPLGARIHARYGDDAIVQRYVPGRNVRASFLAVDAGAGTEALGVAVVDSGADFQIMADSLALYGTTGLAARAEDRYAEPLLEPLAATEPDADRAVRAIANTLMDGLGLRDVFSLDLRVEPDGKVHLLEFEVCPGLPCFDFRAYCRDRWGLTLAEAIAAAAAVRLVPEAVRASA